MTTVDVAPSADERTDSDGGRSWRHRRKSVLATVFMLAFLCYFLVPLAWLLISSTKTNGTCSARSGSGSPAGSTCGTTCRRCSTTPTASSALARQLGVVLVARAHSARHCSRPPPGTASPSSPFLGKSAMLGVVLGAIAVPATALAIPTYLLFSKIGS